MYVCYVTQYRCVAGESQTSLLVQNKDLYCTKTFISYRIGTYEGHFSRVPHYPDEKIKAGESANFRRNSMPSETRTYIITNHKILPNYLLQKVLEAARDMNSNTLPKTKVLSSALQSRILSVALTLPTSL